MIIYNDTEYEEVKLKTKALNYEILLLCLHDFYSEDAVNIRTEKRIVMVEINIAVLSMSYKFTS